MNNTSAILLFIHLMLLANLRFVHAQDSLSPCVVRMFNLGVSYKGECKDGLADGKGEANGLHRYDGYFKNGLPNGYGVYYYDDSTYYAGYFLNGLKEGKGESHFIRKGIADSIVKGYWSGNEFRGKKYITYDFDGGTKFDRYEINASPGTGHTISFEIYTTSGSPDGFPTDLQGKPGYVLKLDELNVGNNIIIRLLSEVITPTRTFVTYDINVFPAILYGTMSNGDSFKLHLYKNAKWTARFYVNK
jgi:hypothetical protein